MNALFPVAFATLADYCIDRGYDATFSLPIGSQNIRLAIRNKKSTKFHGKDTDLESLIEEALISRDVELGTEQFPGVEAFDEVVTACAERGIGFKLDCQWYRDEPRYSMSFRCFSAVSFADDAPEASLEHLESVLSKQVVEGLAAATAQDHTFGVFKSISSDFDKVMDKAIKTLESSNEELIENGKDLTAAKQRHEARKLAEAQRQAQLHAQYEEEEEPDYGVLEGSAKQFIIYGCGPTSYGEDGEPIYQCADETVHLAAGACGSCGQALTKIAASDVDHYLTTYQLMA